MSIQHFITEKQNQKKLLHLVSIISDGKNMYELLKIQGDDYSYLWHNNLVCYAINNPKETETYYFIDFNEYFSDNKDLYFIAETCYIPKYLDYFKENVIKILDVIYQKRKLSNG